MNKTVWKFTNQHELNKKEFIRYFEKKVFATIRKYGMLSKSRVVKLKKGCDLNTLVLRFVLERKFDVRFALGNPSCPPPTAPNKLVKSKSRLGVFSSVNLSEVSEMIFKNVLKGNFNKKGLRPEELKAPLYFLSDAEVELYARLVGVKGSKRKKDKKIQELFSRFMKKNPDLERNVVKGWGQLK